MDVDIDSLIIGLSWPFIVFVGLILYRKPISHILGNVKSIKHKESEVDFGQQSLPNEPKSINDVSHEITMNSYENPIFHDLVLKEMENNKPLNDEDDIARLKYAIQDTAIVLGIERVYRDIYGSQHRAMIFALNNENRITNDQLKKFYFEAKQNFSKEYENVIYPVWLNFLLDRKLLIEIGTPNNFELTTFGQAYSRYMQKYIYPSKLY